MKDFVLFVLFVVVVLLYQWHWTSKMNQAQCALFRFDTLKTFYSLFLIVIVNADHPKCFRCFSTAAVQMTLDDKIKHFCEWIPFSNLMKLSYFFSFAIVIQISLVKCFHSQKSIRFPNRTKALAHYVMFSDNDFLLFKIKRTKRNMNNKSPREVSKFLN